MSTSNSPPDPTTLPTVSSGDLIRANDWNTVVKLLIAYDQRLKLLETSTLGGGVTGPPPTGRVNVSPPKWSSQTISAGPTTVTFNVFAFLTGQENFKAVATTTCAGASASVVDSNNQAISHVTLPAMSLSDPPIPITVQLTLPQSGSGTISLVLTSLRNPSGITGGAATSDTFTINQPPPQPGNILLPIKDVPFGGATIDATNTITITTTASGGQRTGTVQAQPGNLPAGTPVNYNVSTTVDATGWTAVPTINSFTASQAVGPSFQITITGPATATAPTKLHISVVSSDKTQATNPTYFGNQPYTVQLGS
jgi:hypothetical protein